MDFPTLTAKPTGLEEQWENPGISSKMEDGSEISRAKFTKSRGTFKITYNYVSDGDYALWVDFYRNTCHGVAEKFNWTHPVTNTGYVVRCAEFHPSQAVAGHGWSMSITLREA